MNEIQKRREAVAEIRRLLDGGPVGKIRRALNSKDPGAELAKILMPGADVLAKTVSERVRSGLPLAKDAASRAAIDAAVAKAIKAATIVPEEQIARLRATVEKIDTTLLLAEGRLASLDRSLSKAVTSAVADVFRPLRDQLDGIEERVSIYEMQPAEAGRRPARPS